MVSTKVPSLQPLGPGLWIADQAQRFLGLELGARMSVVRLDDDRLLLYSPIARTPALAAGVAELGTPSLLIAPNRFHHLYVADWQAAHPEARLCVAHGLERKRPDLRDAAVLEPAQRAADPANHETGPREALPSEVDEDRRLAGLQREGVELMSLEGAPLVNESVLFHRPSATLVVSDLLFHIGRERPLATRLAFRLMGAYGRPSVTPLERLLIRDRRAFQGSLERILAWPFARIVPAHGAVVERDARDALRDAYRWILG